MTAAAVAKASRGKPPPVTQALPAARAARPLDRTPFILRQHAARSPAPASAAARPRARTRPLSRSESASRTATAAIASPESRPPMPAPRWRWHSAAGPRAAVILRSHGSATGDGPRCARGGSLHGSTGESRGVVGDTHDGFDARRARNEEDPYEYLRKHHVGDHRLCEVGGRRGVVGGNLGAGLGADAAGRRRGGADQARRGELRRSSTGAVPSWT